MWYQITLTIAVIVIAGLLGGYGGYRNGPSRPSELPEEKEGMVPSPKPDTWNGSCVSRSDIPAISNGSVGRKESHFYVGYEYFRLR